MSTLYLPQLIDRKFYPNFQVYTATIIDNIPFNPASPIIQLLAEDADIGKNGALYFYIIGGNEKGQFKIDNSKGIIYPNTSFVGQKGATFELTVQVYDEAGTVQAWTNPDQAIIAISVENVRTHHHMFSRILIFLFVNVFFKKNLVFLDKNIIVRYIGIKVVLHGKYKIQISSILYL